MTAFTFYIKSVNVSQPCEHLIGAFVLCGEEKMGERNPVPAVCLKEVVFPRGWNLLRRRQPPPVLAVSRRGISFSPLLPCPVDKGAN